MPDNDHLSGYLDIELDRCVDHDCTQQHDHYSCTYIDSSGDVHLLDFDNVGADNLNHIRAIIDDLVDRGTHIDHDDAAHALEDGDRGGDTHGTLSAAGNEVMS